MPRFGPGKHSTFAGVARAVKRARRWKGTELSGTLAALTLTNQTIFAPVDYEQSATLEAAGSTLATVVGSFTLSSDIVGVPSFGNWMLAMYDLNEALPTTIDTIALTDEDVLAAGTFGMELTSPMTINVKVKTLRRLKNTRMVLTFGNTSAGAMTFKIGLRSLILGG